MNHEDIGMLMVLGCWFSGLAFAHFAPEWLRQRHIRDQDRLMEKCRALYVLAVHSLSAGDETGAHRFLRQIRSIEAHWRFGLSVPYRLALAAYAIALGITGATLLRLGPLIMFSYPGDMSALKEMIVRTLDPALLIGINFSPTIYALFSTLLHFSSPWVVDNCGDRLERLLKAGRGMTFVPPEEQVPEVQDGLSPRELLGLDLHFSRKELNLARRRLAGRCHPDRWRHASPEARHAAEEAMKRVNAAYDELKDRAY